MSNQQPDKQFGSFPRPQQPFLGVPAFGDRKQPFATREAFIVISPPVEPSFAVQIVKGEPVVMDTTTQTAVGDQDNWIVNPNNMIHVSGTYDTYRCNDCDIVLSGYKRGDPMLNKHIYKDTLQGGKCKYIKTMFINREKELAVLKGTLRFQHGHMAFPEFLMYAKHQYIPIDGTKYCVVCASTGAQDHYPACSDMVIEIKKALKDMTFDVPLETTLLFRQLVSPSYLFSHFTYQSNSTLETDGCMVKKPYDFTVLGEPAGMEHVKEQRDMHTCRRCNLTIGDFVQGDTLLGEHVYHVYNRGGTCPLLECKFGFNRERLKLTLGCERYRKGQIAFPEDMVDSVSGFNNVDKVNVCMMCGETAVQGTFLSPKGHKKNCLEMYKSLMAKLRIIRFIM